MRAQGVTSELMVCLLFRVAAPGASALPLSPKPPALTASAFKPAESVHHGSKPWLKGAGLAVLTTCIILLAAAVGLGIRYWQVSGQLQKALQKHAAQSTALAQRIDLQEGSLTQKEDRLRQAMTELSSTREALRKSQEATRKTQEQLREASHSLGTLKQEKDETEAELQQATEELASVREALRKSRESTEKTQEELQETEEFLREANRNLEAVKWEKDRMEANLLQATICRQTGTFLASWAVIR
nr:putative golgin subfamily A member 6-like protein 19 [Anolis sagrei ordinatus]